MMWLTLVCFSLLCLAHASAVIPPTYCGRPCLTKITADYVDGLQLQNLTYVALAKDVRYTDAGVDSKPGRGLMWSIAGKVRLPWRQAIYDVNTGQVFFNAIITNLTNSGSEEATPADSVSYDYTVRLKIQHRMITEIEEIHNIHPPTATGILAFDTNAHHEPDRTWDDIIPESERLTPSELIQTAYSYWVAVNGTYPAVGPGAVFGPECQRIEFFSYTTNGQYAPGGCGPGIPIWTLSNPRIYIADPTRGVVAGFFNLQRPGRHIVVSEWFKIKDRYISQLEAFFDVTGQNQSGWASFQEYQTFPLP